MTAPDSRPSLGRPAATGPRSVDERAHLIALLRRQPNRLSWSALADEIAEHGDARSVWESYTEPTLIPPSPDDDLLAAAYADLAAWEADGITVAAFTEATYPAQLREIHDFPPLLFARGQLKDRDLGISVVGSRSATSRDLDIAAEVAHGLVDLGIAVLSGLASGVDTAAHTAALRAGGRTVAFLGTGVNKSYPRENAALQRQIQARGLLLSQFWPDSAPQRHSFILRNGVMSGYGRATVVVAAGEKSGTRAQARLATEHGRPVILQRQVANTTAWGAALVGRPGVYVTDGPEDILDIVGDLTRPLDAQLADLVAGNPGR